MHEFPAGTDEIAHTGVLVAGSTADLGDVISILVDLVE